MANRLTSKLFVRLSSFISNEGLRLMFAPFGDVTLARIIVDPKTQRPKGFGSMTYKSEVKAQKAIKVMDGMMVDGRLFFVEAAHPEDTGP